MHPVGVQGVTDHLFKLQAAANVVQKTACGIPGKTGMSVPKVVGAGLKSEEGA